MEEKNDFALVRKPSGAVEKAAVGTKRILSGIVADTLDLARKIARKEVSLAAAPLRSNIFLQSETRFPTACPQH